MTTTENDCPAVTRNLDFLFGVPLKSQPSPTRRHRVSAVTEHVLLDVDGELIDTATWSCTCGAAESYSEHELPLRGQARSAAYADRRAHLEAHRPHDCHDHADREGIEWVCSRCQSRWEAMS